MASQTIDELIIGLENAAKDETIPSWASLIINSSKAILMQLKNIGELENKITKLESDVAIAKRVGDQLGAENIRLNVELDELRMRIDDNEQRNRNNCLLIHGIEESPEENTDDKVVEIVNKELGVILTKDDIQRSHRLGIKISQRVTRSARVRSRPIIFRLSSYRKRHEIYSNKRNLKGKPFTITENLTKHRYDLFKQAISRLGKGRCWTVEGRITTKVGDNYHVIKSLDDLEELCRPEEQEVVPAI